MSVHNFLTLTGQLGYEHDSVPVSSDIDVPGEWTSDGAYWTPDHLATVSTESTELILTDGTAYTGRLQHDADGQPIVITVTCGHCGFTWNDALMTSLTPAPAGRCPNEYNHQS